MRRLGFLFLLIALTACAAPTASVPPTATRALPTAQPSSTPTRTPIPPTPTVAPTATPVGEVPAAFPPAPIVVLGDQANWRYTTTAPNGNWTSETFDDQAWAVAHLPLGTNSNNVTKIPANKSRTVYVRTIWDVRDPAAWRMLTLALDYQHGAVVYLNGTEIARANLEPKQTANTPALANHDTPADRLDVTHALALIKPGRNVVAIETHNSEDDTTIRISAQLWALPKSNVAGFVYEPILGLIGADTVTLQAESDQPAMGVVELRPANGGAVTTQNFVTTTTHRITLKGLQPGTTYHYRLGLKTAAAISWSQPGQWTTDAGSGQSFRMAVWGDNRPSSGNAMPSVFTQLLAQVEKRGPFALGITLGDNVQTYNTVTDERTLRNLYLGYLSGIGAFARQTPFYSVLGNHDGPGCRPCEEAYRRYLVLPEQNDRTYYSFNYGSVHLVVLNDQQDQGTQVKNISDAEWAWLEKDLAANRQPITLVFTHQPVFHASAVHDAYEPRVAQVLHRLFVRAGVTAVFAGHEHYYDFYEQDGIAYVISGGAGSPLYDQPYHPAWQKNHALILNVTPAQMTIEAILPDGTALDKRVVTVKAH